MASRQNANYRQQLPIGLTQDDQLKRFKGELCLPGRFTNFNSYHFLEQNHSLHHKMVEGVTIKQAHAADSFVLPSSKMSPSIPVQISSNVKAFSSTNFSGHLIHPAKTNRSFRDSVDSDAMSNHTQSSDDSISCTTESKETYSSQFNNYNTANSVPLNASLITNKEREEAVASLLCTPYPQISSTDTSQQCPSTTHTQPQLNISMTAQQVIAACANVPDNSKIISSIVSDDGQPPLPPDSPYPPVFCEPDSFLPTPCIMVDSKKEAFGIELQRSCLQHPIVIIRNLASVLKLGMIYCYLYDSFFSFVTIFRSWSFLD